MAEWEAGSAFVTLLPSARGFSNKAKRELAGQDLSVDVDLDANAEKLRQAIKQVKGELAALDRERTNPSIDLDVAVAEARIAELREKLDDLGKKEASPKVQLETAKVKRELAAVEKQLAALNQKRADVDVGAETAAAQATLQALENKLAQVDAQRAQPKVSADVSGARSQLQQLEAQLATLSSKRATPEVNLKVANTRADILRIEAELSRLSMLRPSPQVDLDIAAASAKIAILSAQLSNLSGKNVRLNVNAGNLSSAVGITFALAGALGAVAAAAPAAAAGLAAVAGAAGALGQAAGAAAFGFSGIGDALTAVRAEQDATTSSGASAANAQQAQAKQIASAASALQSAQTAQARTAIQGAQSVAAAQRALAAAQVAADRAAITGAQQVAAARRALAQAQISAARSIEDAQRSYTRSLQQEQYAQEALTDARKSAQRALRDLQLQASGAALSQERAEINLARARAKLQNAQSAGMPEGLDKQEIELDVREAEQSLAETQNRLQNLTEDQAEWARTGVEGSQQVVAAQRSLQAAQDAVADSARQVARAQEDGARQVEEAQIALSQAIQQAGWAQEDAARGVEEAQIALAQAQQQAQWANEDAAKAVADAQRALADAYADTGAAGSAAANKAADALAKLTPAGREFVRFLMDEWFPTWKKTSDAVATELLPKVQEAMRNLLELEPLVRAGMVATADVMGDLAVRASELATSGPFQANFAQIMSSNTRQLESYGNAGLSLFGAFTDLAAAAGPVQEQFARLADYSAQAFESWIIGARQSGELDAALRTAGDTLMWLGQQLITAGAGIWNLAQGFAPLGAALVTIAANTLAWLGWLAELNPTITSIIGGLALGAVAVSKLGTAMAGLAAAQGASGIAGFANVMRTVFSPAALYGTAALTSLRTSFAAAGAAAGGSVIGMTGSATAGGKVAGAMTNAGRAVAGAAAALPLLGLAVAGVVIGYDSLTTSSGEAADALLQGGAAAASMRAELSQNDAKQAQYTATMGTSMGAVREWLTAMLGTETTTKQANAALNAHIATLGPLQAAQALATLAQSEYEAALRETGPTSQRTSEAQRNLAGTTAEVERQQEAARRATMNATQALQEQQDQILGSINSRLQFESSTRAVARAQTEYADELRKGGPAALETQEALGRLQEAQTRQAGAAQQAAIDEAKRRGETDTSRAATDALARSVGDMVLKTQGELTPALAQMVSGLDMAGLSAAGATVKVNEAGQSVAIFPNGKTVVLDANTSPALIQTAQAKALIDATKGTVGVDADPGPGVAKVGNFKLTTDATTGIVKIDGNITPADQQRLGIQAKTDGTTGTIFINGNPVPADGQLNGMRIKVDGTTGMMTIDGNPAPADQETRGAHDRARAPQIFSLSANPDYQGISGFFRWLGDSIAAAGRAFSGIFSAAGRMLGFAAGGIVMPMEVGGTLMPLAAGDFMTPAPPKSIKDTVPSGRRLSPMQGGRARTVAPNTWRVIGDNMRDPESYIPINDSPRSKAILKTTASAMGYALVDADSVAMRIGGMLSSAGRVSGMAAGGRVTPVARLATGATLAPSQRRFDTPSLVAAQRMPEATSGRSGGQQPLIGQYNHYSTAGQSAQDGIEAVMYRTRQARRGGGY